jgi:hypothetical protein
MLEAALTLEVGCRYGRQRIVVHIVYFNAEEAQELGIANAVDAAQAVEFVDAGDSCARILDLRKAPVRDEVVGILLGFCKLTASSRDIGERQLSSDSDLE